MRPRRAHERGQVAVYAVVLFPLLVALAPLLTGAKHDRRHWLLVLAAVIVVAGYFVLRTIAVPSAVPIDGRVSFARRLETFVNTFGLYMRIFVWPFAHRAWYEAGGKPVVALPNIIATMLFGAATALFALSRRFLTTLWGCAWAVFFLLPVTAVTTIGPLAAERLLFLPSAGLVMVVVSLLSRLPQFRVTARRALAVGCGLVIVAADGRIPFGWVRHVVRKAVAAGARDVHWVVQGPPQ